ncbi:hypothetical protein CfE428DRAFT_3803 [Chthoniobacter flavus Ellin428]|uniref:Uncharacterized protein n=1 Tax=Chthoniobacter flavus Ellin428 TaxID=497964 RepID=B4D4G5_9BACT|nr:hypothetical protein CfE428DRAFT_3803 [Chthoniobacter flavus Ellin428]TCO88996.1 hypothetical protein EV701_11527 [Chthoniobacter flavus]
MQSSSSARSFKPVLAGASPTSDANFLTSLVFHELGKRILNL